MGEDKGLARSAETGSHAAHEAPAGLRPAGFDPARGCVFCDPANIRSPLEHWGPTLVFEPLSPVAPGHLLVVPREHVADFTVDTDITARVMRVAGLVAARRGGDFNLIASKGEAATQSVMHFHVHLVPRADGDGLLLPWTGQQAARDSDGRGAAGQTAEQAGPEGRQRGPEGDRPTTVAPEHQEDEGR